MKRSLMLLAVLLCLAVTVVRAEAISDGAVEQVLELSGLPEQMNELSGMVLSGMEQAGSQAGAIDQQVMSALYRAVDDAFTADNILSPAKANIKQSVSGSDGKMLLEWYESPLGKRITQAEIDASSPAAYMEMNQMGKTLFEDEDRVVMAQSIAGLTRSVDMVMSMQTNIAVAVYAALTQGQDPDSKVDVAAFRENMQSREELMRDNVEQFVVLSLIYSYREISLEDQKRYLGFLDSDESRRFTESVVSGIETGMSTAIVNMRDSVYRTLHPVK